MYIYERSKVTRENYSWNLTEHSRNVKFVSKMEQKFG